MRKDRPGLKSKNTRKTQPQFGSLRERVTYGIEDSYDEIRFRVRQAKKEWRHQKKTLSALEFRRYRRRQLQKLGLKAVSAVAAVCLCCFLAVGLVGLLTGQVSGSPDKLARKTAAQLEAEAQSKAEVKAVFPEKEVTLGSTGCLFLHSPFLTSYSDAEGEYDFSPIFTYITPYYSEPDYMTCEFEGALCGPRAGYSGYPLFRSPDAIVEDIRDSGVDLQMFATNHLYDGNSVGLRRSMSVFQEKGIAFTGARISESLKRYYVADIQGVSVGFMNYVYETDGQGTNINGLPVQEEDEPLINSFDYDDLESFYQEAESNIRQMRSDGARFIVTNLHWGTEYQLRESQTQRDIAQRLCDLGVDALIGGHPHCEQPIDVLESEDGHQMFCIYSTGNALSNQRKYLMDSMPTGHTEDGVIVTLTLRQDSSGAVSISDVELLPTWVYRYADGAGSKYLILPLDDVAGLEQLTGIDGIQAEAQASYDRTMEELGPGLEKAKEAFQ